MPTIHPTAVVAREAELDDTVHIGPYVVIDGPVRIARGVRIIAQAYVTGQTEIGENCEIHPFVAIGGPPQDHAYEELPSYCRIGARNVIREGVTIHRGTHAESATVVGSDCMLMCSSHVGHNCSVGDHVIMTNGVLLAGHVQVGDHAVFGGGASVHQFVRIGERAMIGGATIISQDAAPFMTYIDRNRCVGINRVGLRRGGFSSDEIEELRMLHRQLFFGNAAMNKAAALLRQTVRTDAGRRLVEFILSGSKRGVGGHEGPRAKGAQYAAAGDAATGRIELTS